MGEKSLKFRFRRKVHYELGTFFKVKNSARRKWRELDCFGLEDFSKTLKLEFRVVRSRCIKNYLKLRKYLIFWQPHIWTMQQSMLYIISALFMPACLPMHHQSSVPRSNKDLTFPQLTCTYLLLSCNNNVTRMNVLTCQVFGLEPQ